MSVLLAKRVGVLYDHHAEWAKLRINPYNGRNYSMMLADINIKAEPIASRRRRLCGARALHQALAAIGLSFALATSALAQAPAAAPEAAAPALAIAPTTVPAPG